MERSHLYGVIKKEIIRTLRRLKSVSGSDYTRLARRRGLRLGRTRMENSRRLLFCRRSKPPTCASFACLPPLKSSILLPRNNAGGTQKMCSACVMARRRGFEPPEAFDLTRFPIVRLKPLSHLRIAARHSFSRAYNMILNLRRKCKRFLF